MKRLLVVVPTLDEAHHIAAVVDALVQDPPADADLRLVVADGGSADATVEIVRRLQATRPWLRLLHNPRRLQGAAVNLAVQLHGHDADVLVRCDAHAGYPRGYLRLLLASLERTGADAVVVPMDSVGHSCLQRAVAWVSDSAIGSGGSAHRGGRRSGWVDHGHHAAFRIDSFRRAGGYDESFSHNEDAELDCRQRALGGRIYLDAGIRLSYRPRAGWRALWRQYFGYGRGRARTVRRHPGSMRARQLAVPVHWAVTLAAVAIAPVWPWLLAWPALYLGVLAAASVRIARAHRSACGLLAGPAAACMHAAWASGFLWSLARLREPAWNAPPVPSGAHGSGGP